jgi:hypothetical protein
MADESFSGLNEKSIKNAQKIKSEVGEIKGAIDDLNKSLQLEKETLSAIQKSFSGITNAADAIKNNNIKITEALAQQKNQLNFAKDLTTQISKLREQVATADDKTRLSLKEQIQNITELKSQAKQLADVFGDIAKSTAELNSSTVFFSKLAEATKNVPILKQAFEAAAKASKEATLKNAESSDISKSLSKLSKEELESGKGLTKEKLKQLGLSEAAKNQSGATAAAALRNFQATTKQSNVFMSGLSAGFKTIGQGVSSFFKGGGWIGVLITGAIELFKLIKDAMFGASKQVAEFQRGLMVSSEEAENIRQRAYDISAQSSRLADTQGKIVILQKQIVEAQNATNNAFETSIDFTSELGETGEKLLAQSAILKDNIGLEAEAQAEITRESIRTGKEIEQITKNTAGNIAFIGLEKKIQFDINKLLTEATKIQGNLRLNFKGSTEEIAKAVAQAKLLGVNLSQLEKVQSSLLNFEESISAELEAELLTGKDFNLERARTLALEGDLVGMAKALNDQGITYNKLQDYNIIQRQAIAKALGMEVNELADALKKQEEYNALQLKARQIGIVNKDIEKMSLREIFEEGERIGRSEENIIALLGEEIYKRKLAEDAQTKFNKSLEMAKEQFEKFVSSGTLDKFASFLTQFINTVAKDGLRTALFKDYSEAIAEDQLKKAKERKKQEGGEGSLSTQKDILVAKRDVLENEKIGFFESFGRGIVSTRLINKEKDIEIEKLNKAIENLNAQLNKGITANTYLDYNKVSVAENTATTKTS